MNTECIIVATNDRAQIERLKAIAEIITAMSENAEIYPVAISRITEETSCYKTYDESAGYYPKQRKTVLNPGDHVLFIAGKLRFMDKATLRLLTPKESKSIWSDFAVLFPSASNPFFTDIIEY